MSFLCALEPLEISLFYGIWIVHSTCLNKSVANAQRIYYGQIISAAFVAGANELRTPHQAHRLYRRLFFSVEWLLESCRVMWLIYIIL